jgi:hypothetical protein
MYQIPFVSFSSLAIEDKEKGKKENFKIKKAMADVYALGGRLTGKSIVVIVIDILISFFHKLFNKGVVSSFDSIHLRGIMELVITGLDNHPILKLLNAKSKQSPAYKIRTDNGCLLESVNENTTGKQPGGQWYQKHVDIEWAEEASFITDTINKKKIKAVSELGCVFRYSGMTTFAKNSPMGRIFDDLRNAEIIVNLPSYVNPNYDDEDYDKDIKEFGGLNSIGFLVQVLGKIIEYGDSVFDMELVRLCYKKDLPIKSFEVTKDNFYRYKDIIIIERPINAEKVMVALDKGEGAAPTEITIMYYVNNKWYYDYNISCFKLKPDADEEIVNFIIEKVKANIIAIDITSGGGKSLFCNLSNKYPENCTPVAFNENIDIDFEKDDKGKPKYDNNGKPIYKTERVDIWSIQCLKQLFYNQKISCLMDFKLDTQINGVIVMQSKQTGKAIYGFKTANHLFQAFQVAAIADWITEFKNIKPIEKRSLPLGVCDSI